MTVLETERLILRGWRTADREPFARMNADARVMEYFPNLLTAQESNATVDRIEAHFDRHGFGPFAVQLRATGVFIGFIGLSVPAFEANFTPCVEIGWRLDSGHWGQGLATEGAREALGYGLDVLRLGEIVSFTAAGNLRSRRVMERIGMARDAAGDFDHPGLPEGHRLRRHVLYRTRAVTTALSPIGGIAMVQRPR